MVNFRTKLGIKKCEFEFSPTNDTHGIVCFGS